MTRSRLLGGMIVLILVGLIGFLLVSQLFAPETSTVEIANCRTPDNFDQCVLFPTISGQNLIGDDRVLPDDLAGALNLLIVPFDREQQRIASGWLPLAQELAKQYPNFQYYDVPIFPELAPAIRMMSRTGLNALISDDHIRSITITVYLEDRDAFLEALSVPNVEQIRVYLLDSLGRVVWRAEGEYTEEMGEQLEGQVKRFLHET